MNVALQVRAKNGVLWKFLEEKGWTQSDFARALKVDVVEVGRWFNMKAWPRNEKRMFAVAALVGKPPEEIFPLELRKSDWLTGTRQWSVYRDVDMLSLSDESLLQLAGPQEEEPEETTSVSETRDIIVKLLLTLTPREEVIMRMHFGIDEPPKTYREIGEYLGMKAPAVQATVTRVLEKIKNRTARFQRKMSRDFTKESGLERIGQWVEDLSTPSFIGE